MNEVAALPAEDRAELFAITAAQKSFSVTGAEKDFWVCWTLKQLFPAIGDDPDYLWKGGTTLSKVFGAISRFSEDIDLSVRPERFGAEHVDVTELSGTKRRKVVDALIEAGRAHVREQLLPDLVERFSAVLGEPGAPAGWSVRIAQVDGQEQPDALEFFYPTSTSVESYISPRVLLEFGFRAQLHPWHAHTISPYAAAVVPQAFADGADCAVPVLDAERTFWEKATLVHAEFHREAPRSARRMSRHYYDLAQLARTEIARRAIEDIALLETVARHKNTYFPARWARYDEARPGTLRLVPHAALLELVRSDYGDMREMFFGEEVPFDSIVEALQSLEERINAS